MKGDFSRQTFDPTKHYSDVLMQQGRVQLDADWNEQQAIHRYRAETGAYDIIGFSGAPEHNPGFAIVLSQDRSTFGIGRGNYYVAGILCENETTVPYEKQPDLLDAPAVRDLLRQAETTVGIIYLDVWRRHVTALDDASVRESALGGPDTTTRIKTVWQVKILPVKEPQSAVVGCETAFEEWDKLLASDIGALSARSRPAANAGGPCILPPSAGYRGLENQLYRVEIHQGGVVGVQNRTPTFKWSRDNGIVVTAIEKISGQEVTVRDLGPDEVLGFASGQWVEIVDDAAELNGKPGQLLQIDSINRAGRVVKLTAAPTPLASGAAGVDPARHPKMRRWDSVKDVAVQVPSTNDGFLALENGVEVKFESGSYNTGDYWLIPSRTAINAETGTVEWPFQTPQLSLGIVHHYCRLALLRLNAADNTLAVQDCRRLFSPLTGVSALHVIGTSWSNDDLVTLDELQNNGLRITLDGVPLQPTTTPPTAPHTVNPATLMVTVEAPLSAPAGSNAVVPRTDAVLNGRITVADNNIQWNPEMGELLKLLEGPPSLRRIRVRMQGDKIWNVQGQRVLYLDGQTFGQPGFRRDGTTPRTDLLFPSGDGARASNFESWMYVPAQITVPPPDLQAFAITPGVVQAGESVSYTLMLSGAAPAGGVTVPLAKTLLSGGDPVRTFPTSVQVPEGQATITFTVPTQVNVAGSVSIKATLRQVEKSATFATQVVSVAVIPTAATLLINGSQQFTANVQGTQNKLARFSIQEGAAGGSIVQSTGTTATYTAPGQPGTFHIVVTSSDDATKSAVATVVVRPKGKDTKDPKDTKEVEPKVRKEFDKLRDKVEDKIRVEKIRDLGPVRGPEPRRLMEPTDTSSPAPEATGQAFIRSDERPPVGEPQRTAEKPSRKRRTRKEKK
ncbi:MAG TPA: DUF6519 domain-containing protein [Nitrospiraceae bacterium]|nr:DUF6519 domain-containing protein [Nitrospiraceae bacterium]